MGCCGTQPGVDVSYPSWVKVTLAFGAFSAAALTANANLYSLPAGGVLHAVKIKQSASFTGGAVASCTVSVGIAGNVSKYASAFDVFQAPASNTFQVTGTVGGEDQASAAQLTATATSTGANLNALTAGSVDVWLLISVAL